MPANMKLYPPDWNTKARPSILARAGEVRASRKIIQEACCEGCGVVNHSLVQREGKAKLSPIVLTVAHLNHDITDDRPENLRAWCQKCHLSYDAPMHARHAALTRARKKREKALAAGQQLLFD